MVSEQAVISHMCVFVVRNFCGTNVKAIYQGQCHMSRSYVSQKKLTLAINFDR